PCPSRAWPREQPWPCHPASPVLNAIALTLHFPGGMAIDVDRHAAAFPAAIAPAVGRRVPPEHGHANSRGHPTQPSSPGCLGSTCPWVSRICPLRSRQRRQFMRHTTAHHLCRRGCGSRARKRLLDGHGRLTGTNRPDERGHLLHVGLAVSS